MEKWRRNKGGQATGPIAKAMHRSSYLIRTTQLEVTPYRLRPPSPSPGQKFWERACDWPSHDAVHTPVNDSGWRELGLCRGKRAGGEH